jgi:peptide/nickel transport system substrate-binding protein
VATSIRPLRDWQNWSMIKSLFDGLMDYRPGTTELVNDLAESYAISEDGKVSHLCATQR